MVISGNGAISNVLAEIIYVLEEFNSVHTIKTLLRNTNTGFGVDIVTVLENKIKRKLQTN